MITHEEMRDRINNINKFDLVDTEVMTLDYITQQEKKNKLLDLYRKWFLAKTTKQQDDITNQIIALEKELSDEDA